MPCDALHLATLPILFIASACYTYAFLLFVERCVRIATMKRED